MKLRPPLFGPVTTLLCILFASPCLAQGTWVYGECERPLGGAFNRVVSFSVDSRIARDPLGKGSRIRAQDPRSPLVSRRESHAGGVAIDKINKLLYVTHGDFEGGLTLTISPLGSTFCPRGSNTRTMTVTGPYPFTDGRPSPSPAPVTGISIEYWTNPETGLGEPYRMWCTAGVDDVGDILYSYGEYHFFWMTPCVPRGEAQGAWSTTVPVRPIPTRVNARDIAFGIVEVIGTSMAGRHSCLFAIVTNHFGVSSFVDVWDVNTGEFLYTNDGSGMTETMGIAIDTSTPVDMGPGVQPPPLFGPPRKVSGRVLVLGTREGFASPYIRDITSSELTPGIYTPEGIDRCNRKPYIGGMAYSADMSNSPALGSASGTGCLGTPSGVNCDIEIAYDPATACPPVNPPFRQDPRNPGQPLASMTPGIAPTFSIAACNLPFGESPATATPFLLIQKNGVSPWTDPGTMQSLIVTPNGTSVIALPGTWTRGNTRVVESSGFTDPRLAPPASSIPHQPYGRPRPYFYYFGQWVFLCGSHPGFPASFPAGVSYFTSRPFRLAISSPH